MTVERRSYGKAGAACLAIAGNVGEPFVSLGLVL